MMRRYRMPMVEASTLDGVIRAPKYVDDLGGFGVDADEGVTCVLHADTTDEQHAALIARLDVSALDD